MPNTSKKYNSINDSSAQALRNNQNVLELLTKIDQALNSNDSYVTAKTVDGAGQETSSQIPTMGHLKQKVDQLFKMVRILSGVDGNPVALQLSDNIFKRVVVADLNIEPKPIPALNAVSVFKADPNHFFDSLLNPKISIQIDLTDKIAPDTRYIESKRFIVEFNQILTVDPNTGTETIELTANGAARKAEFESKYKGKSNIDIVEFVTWLETDGLVNQADDTLLDQEYFKIEPNRLQKKGSFTVLNTDLDVQNKKLWYVLDTLTYYDISDLLNPAKPIELKVGDLVNVNPSDSNVKSTTVYKIVELSTITSEFRVRFEAVYGEEPIPVRLDALSIYSDVVTNRSVKISVGFDQYCVVFIRQIDTNNNLIGMDWSPGVGFWTNELRLDNNNGALFSDYYIKTVYDYGIVLDDLVGKKVPNYFGVKPNAPVLDLANFKVVQINGHLTQTVEAEKIRDLHNQKNNLSSEISQIQTALDKQNKLIQTTSFASTADRKRAEDELTLLTTKLSTKTATKFTVVQDILANKKNLNKIPAVFHVRGFFAMPAAAESTKTVPQEVVQFEIWYRKLSKSGTENEILTISDIDNNASRASSSINTTAQENVSRPKTVNGAFSNWVRIKSDGRKRIQDTITQEWKWQIEDVSDANTPNINQIDISIEPGEIIELKVKSLSEAGWPETPVESDFSNTIQVIFPDDLNSVLNEDEFILKEAQAEDMKIKFERSLEDRNLSLHLNTGYRVGDVYYAHRSPHIDSGFKDTQGNVINLYDQLLAMVSKITSLEELVSRAKGILEVYLDDNGNRIRLFNGNNLSFNLNLEDYMTPTKIGVAGAAVDSTSRTYKNDLIVIQQYTLLLKNSAETAQLGLLSYRGYGDAAGMTPFTMAYDGKYRSGTDRGIQAIWTTSDSTILTTSATVDENNAGALSVLQTPKYRATQKNNQWLWLVTKDLNGNYIYDSEVGQNYATFASPYLLNELWQTPAANYVSAAGATNSGVTVTVSTTASLKVGMTVRVTSGTGAFLNNTTVVTINSGTTFTVSVAPSVNLSASAVVTGSFNAGSLIHTTITKRDYNLGFLTGTSQGVPVNSSNITAISDAVNWNVTELYNASLNLGTNGYMASTIHPVVSGFTDIVDTSTQLVKYMKAGESNLISIPIYIFVKPYTGTLVTSQLNPAVPFDDTNYRGTGDMPVVATASNIKKVGNNLQVLMTDSNSANIIIVGDRVVLSGFIDPNLTSTTNNVNDKPLAVVAKSGNWIELAYNPVSLSGTAVTDAAGVIKHVHKKYKRSTVIASSSEYTGVGTELEAYNVLGTVGSDSREVANYVEIKTTTATPTPAKHNKKIRFFFEEENSARPFELQLNFNITQYKPIQIQQSGNGFNPIGQQSQSA